MGAYANWQYDFDEPRPTRRRPYSRKSLRKFARRRAYEAACHEMWERFYEDWDPSEPTKTYAMRVTNFVELSAKWRCYGFDDWWYPYDYYVEWLTVRLKTFPPCPLPD